MGLKSEQKGTIVHELGHVLGLDHPNDDGFDITFTVDETVMSYNEGSAGWNDAFTSNDISLLRHIWGDEDDHLDDDDAEINDHEDTDSTGAISQESADALESASITGSTYSLAQSGEIGGYAGGDIGQGGDMGGMPGDEMGEGGYPWAKTQKWAECPAAIGRRRLSHGPRRRNGRNARRRHGRRRLSHGPRRRNGRNARRRHGRRRLSHGPRRRNGRNARRRWAKAAIPWAKTQKWAKCPAAIWAKAAIPWAKAKKWAKCPAAIWAKAAIPWAKAWAKCPAANGRRLSHGPSEEMGEMPGGDMAEAAIPWATKKWAKCPAAIWARGGYPMGQDAEMGEMPGGDMGGGYPMGQDAEMGGMPGGDVGEGGYSDGLDSPNPSPNTPGTPGVTPVPVIPIDGLSGDGYFESDSDDVESVTHTNWEIISISADGVVDWSNTKWGSIAKYEDLFGEDLNGDGGIGLTAALSNVETDTFGAKLKRDGEKNLYRSW